MAENSGTDPLTALQQTQEAFDQAVANGASTITQPWTPSLVQSLSMWVLVFCGMSLIGASILLWRNKASADEILRIYGVIVIVGLSALLLVVGYSNDQLTPIIGLFGAIVGYLLGKDKKDTGEQK